MSKASISYVIVLGLTIISANFGFAAFNDIGVGARPLGLGGAFVAVADDGNATGYNAGGLGYIKGIQLSFTQARHFAGLINHNYTGVVLPFGKIGAFGVSFGLLGESENIYEEWVITLSYSRKILEQISAGMNVKMLGTSFDKDNEAVSGNEYFADKTETSAATIDLGVLVKPIVGLSIGFAAENLVPADVNISEDVPDEDRYVPRNVRIGLAYNLSAIAQSAQQEALRDVLEYTQGLLEASFRNGETEIHVGAEAWIQKSIGLRAGYGAKSGVGSSSSIALGASIKIPISDIDLQFDYAFQTIITGELDAKSAHRISTNVIF